MKLAVISDIHKDFDKYRGSLQYSNQIDMQGAEILIDAGDFSSDEDDREGFFHDYNYFFVRGNHDYYGKWMPNDPIKESFKAEHEGVSIFGTTMWTELSPSQWLLYKDGLMDTKWIHDWTEEKYNKFHKIQKELIMQSRADVIVTHHAPSELSVAPRFKGDIYNCGFYTELYHTILDMDKPPKYWIHGHMHNRSDYMIGKTRVVANPRGYPWENPWYHNYEPLILEI